MSSASENISRRHLLTGEKGEDLAVRFLKKEGYRIITRNFKTKLGEIDIIAREGEVLVFVEVKTRLGSGFGLPQSAVDLRKQGKITRVALGYISEKNESDAFCRFDVVAIRKEDQKYKVELIRNAFEMAL